MQHKHIQFESVNHKKYIVPTQQNNKLKKALMKYKDKCILAASQNIIRIASANDHLSPK